MTDGRVGPVRVFCRVFGVDEGNRRVRVRVGELESWRNGGVEAGGEKKTVQKKHMKKGARSKKKRDPQNLLHYYSIVVNAANINCRFSIYMVSLILLYLL